MPCLTTVARKVNLFGRDASELTRADVMATYVFLTLTIYIVGWYSQKYFRLAAEDFDRCRLPGNHSIAFCMKDQVVHLGVPYIGVLNGFVIALFRALNMIALSINYICCCSYCCVANHNPNAPLPDLVQVEMNAARDNVITR